MQAADFSLLLLCLPWHLSAPVAFFPDFLFFPGKCSARKKVEIFFKCYEIHGHRPLTKFFGAISFQPGPIPTCQKRIGFNPKDRDKSVITPIFSDVTAYSGNSGPFHRQSHPHVTLNGVAENATNRSPLNCRIESRLNQLFWGNNRLKPNFPEPGTPGYFEHQNRIQKWPNGARKGPGIDPIRARQSLPKNLNKPLLTPFSPTLFHEKATVALSIANLTPL
jgi:hypothetical protein